jgi:hypothetical protein
MGLNPNDVKFRDKTFFKSVLRVWNKLFSSGSYFLGHFWSEYVFTGHFGSRSGSFSHPDLDADPTWIWPKFLLTFFQFLFICFNKHTFKCTKKSNFKHTRVYSDSWGQLCIQTLRYFTSFGFSQMQGKSEHQTFHLKNCTFGAKSLLLVFRAKSTIVGTLIYSKKLGEIGRGIILKWCWTRKGVRIYPIIRYMTFFCCFSPLKIRPWIRIWIRIRIHFQNPKSGSGSARNGCRSETLWPTIRCKIYTTF